MIYMYNHNMICTCIQLYYNICMDTVYIDTVTYLSKVNVLKPFSVLDQILI